MTSRLTAWAVALAVLAVPLGVRATADLESGGLTTLHRWVEASDNLVANPSFESVDAKGWPVGWRGEPRYFTTTPDGAHTGARGARLADATTGSLTPLLTQPLSLAPGWYHVRAWLRLDDVAHDQPNAGVRLALFGTGSTSPVLRGTKPWTEVESQEVLVTPGSSPVLRLEGYGKPTGVAYFDDIQVRRLVAPVVEGFLVTPNYRGMLFDDEPQRIEMSVTVRTEDTSRHLSDLVIRLTLRRDGESRDVATTETVPAQPTFRMTLDPGRLAPGSYTLTLQALGAGHREVVSEYPAYRVVAAPAALRKRLGVYYDRDNVLVLGGRRRFVLGIYDTSGYSLDQRWYDAHFAELRDVPLNMYVNYWLGAAPAPALEALMSALDARGMYYLHTVNSWYPTHANWPRATECGSSSADRLGADRFTACMASALARHRGFAGFYTADEATADRAAQVFHQYEIVRTAAPGGVTFIAQDRPLELGRWRDATDVVGVDPYPIFNIPEGQLAPLETVATWVDQAQASVERSRPVWAVIQFFQFGGKGHWPTYDELRAMSYMAIVGGAKGLLYWSYGAKGVAWVKDPAQRAALIDRLGRVTREIHAIEPALIAPDAPDIVRDPRPPTAIRVLPKRVGDTRYLVAVNVTPRPVDAGLSLAGPAASAEVIGEGRTVSIAAGKLEDRFGPYGVHVYRIGPTS